MMFISLLKQCDNIIMHARWTLFRRFEGQATVLTDALIATGKIGSYKGTRTMPMASSIPEAATSHGEAALNSTSSWLLPHQTGVRDPNIAKQVGSTRTPNGAFALHSLAMYGRS